MSQRLASAIILTICAVGFGWYMSVARKRKSSKVEEFFVAGRNIGVPLFAQTSWGSSFAFGNSIFYAAWLGYTMGLSALWLQGLWAIGMCCYALLLPRLIPFTGNYTLHGFLGSQYGRWCRWIASVVSVIGLTILLGFEVSFAAQYFTRITGLIHFEWIVVVVAATFFATFCSIGGFKANSITDRISNYLGASTLILLIVVLSIKNRGPISAAISSADMKASLFDFSSAAPLFVAGLAFFSLFNIVDMTNWQTVSANSLNSEHGPDAMVKRRSMRNAMFLAAALFIIAPVLTGTWLGFLLRILKTGTDDQASFMYVLVRQVFDSGTVGGVLMIALITFAFMASSLAGIDSWILASTQTLSWDIVEYERFKSVEFQATRFDNATHEAITKRARLILYCVGIGGTVLVYAVSKIWNNIFALQFIIFGGGLSMLPALLWGLFRGNRAGSRILSVGAVTSIGAGYVSAVLLFVISVLNKTPAMVDPLPLISLGVASAVFGIAIGCNALFRGRAVVPVGETPAQS